MRKYQEYNDFIRATREYLNRYNQFQQIIKNLQDDIDGLMQEMASDVAAPISKYGDMPGGGTSELNAVEAAASRHMKMEKEIKEKQRSIDALSRVIRKVDRAFEALDKESQRLIYYHYIVEKSQRKSWRELGEETYTSEKWAAEKARRAVKEMAITIFAKKAMPEQLSLPFVFF